MTREEAVALLERYSNYNGMGIPNLAGCKEAMKVAVDALKEAFPKLAESEDERMIDAIKEAVRIASQKGGYLINAITREEALAWLEKQKEPKPLPPFDEVSPEEKMNHPLYLEGFDTGREVQRVFDEQKPAEWSEEDEERLKAICTYLQDYPRLAKINDVKRFNEYCDWLKSLPLNLKKKNEDVAKLCSKEWSVEDEDRIRQIERIAQQAGCTQKLQEEIHDWLKSLRPSWKPSKEQMNALYYACCIAFEEERDFHPSLSRLYHDLRKLIRR